MSYRPLLGFLIGYAIVLIFNYIKRRKNKREEKPNCIGCKDLDFYNTGEAYCIRENKCNEGCYIPVKIYDTEEEMLADTPAENTIGIVPGDGYRNLFQHQSNNNKTKRSIDEL